MRPISRSCAMDIYLPIAEMAISAQAVLGLGVIVGFLSGVFGVGGGFLATPFLIFMGIPPAIAVGTQSAQLLASSFSGTLYHLRKGNVDREMGHSMLIGSVAGSVIGIGIFALIKSYGQMDFVIPLLYVILLGFIGLSMFWESTYAYFTRGRASKPTSKLTWFSNFIARLPYQKTYKRSGITTSALIPAVIGFVGGLLVSIMGVGGGFIMVPAMLYFLSMPALLVVGTSLYQIVVTSAFSTLMHALSNRTVDLVLASLLIAGSVVGAQIGARAAKYLRGGRARFALALLVLMVAAKLGVDLLVRPTEIFTIMVE